MIFAHLAGFLGQDPETRFTPTGKKVTTLRVATSMRRSKEEKTIWWRVTLWGEDFDRILPYLKKGSAVYVVGQMDMPTTYQNREGHTQISMDLTASYVGFSPYGAPKSDRPPGQQETGQQGTGQQETGQQATSNTPQQEAESPYAMSPMSQGFAKGTNTSANGNEAAASNPFQEDDIPF